MTSARWALLVVTFGVACFDETIPPLRIDGSPGVAPLVSALATDYVQENSRAPVTVGGGLGSSARIAALESDSIDLAMASHGVDSADLARRGIVAHEIARTAVVFAVNSSVPVTWISSRQACDILAGRITRWRQVGGPDRPIVAFMRPDDEVDAEVAREALDCMRGLKVAQTVRIIERPDSMAAALASTPDAFGLTSMPLVQGSEGRIVALALDSVAPTPEHMSAGRYPMSRRAYLLSRTSESDAVKRFLGYVKSDAGAAVLREHGAVPVP